MAMASVSHQLSVVKWTPLLWKPTHSQKQRRGVLPIVCSIAISSAQNKERAKLKEIFEDAYERCRTAPMEGVAFTLDQFTEALEKYDFESEVGTKASFFFFCYKVIITVCVFLFIYLNLDVGLS